MAGRDGAPGAETVRGRATVVPTTAEVALDNESNLSARSAVRTRVLLDVVGHDGPAQFVDVRVPNWLRIVLRYAGSNEELAPALPAQVTVAVALDASTGRVVWVDVEAAQAELDAYRPVATRWWKDTEAPLSSVRGARALPGAALRSARGLAGTWRGALSGLRDDVRRGDGPAPANATEQDLEQIRRSGEVLRHRLERTPKEQQAVRASALQAGPMMVANVRAGAMAPRDIEAWLVLQESSGAITAEEAAAWRAEAGTAP